MSSLLVILLIAFVANIKAFNPILTSSKGRYASHSLKMIDFELNSATYAGIFVATMVPSLIFVKFIGDQADSSRGNLSLKTKEKFKRAMVRIIF